MEKILDKLIEKLDRKLTEARQAYPWEETLSGRFTFGNSVVSYIFRPSGCEVEIYNPVLDTFLDNVAFYCEKRVLPWDSIEVDEDDEWNSNGFRDETDYYNWRYR